MATVSSGILCSSCNALCSRYNGKIWPREEVGSSYPDYLSHEYIKIQFSGEAEWYLLSFLKAADNCLGLHSPGIFFSVIQINFSFSFPCCCNIPDIKFACLTVHKSISGSLPDRKHHFISTISSPKFKFFLNWLTDWLVFLNWESMMDESLSCLLTDSSMRETVVVRLLRCSY